MKCPHCGVNLEVACDDDQFSCANCGTGLTVLCSDGTVSLKPVLDAMKQVPDGTDREAAELALRRLKDELLDSKESLAQSKAKVTELAIENTADIERVRRSGVPVIWVLFFGGLIAYSLNAAMHVLWVAIALGALFFVWVMGYNAWHIRREVKRIQIKYASRRLDVDNRIAELETQISTIGEEIEKQET